MNDGAGIGAPLSDDLVKRGRIASGIVVQEAHRDPVATRSPGHPPFLVGHEGPDPRHPRLLEQPFDIGRRSDGIRAGQVSVRARAAAGIPNNIRVE